MMRLLFVAIASLLALSAGAQAGHPGSAAPGRQMISSRIMPKAQMQEMKMRAPGEAAPVLDKSAGVIKPYYRRPAGAFFGSLVLENGVYSGIRPQGILMMKPFTRYTFGYRMGGADQNDRVTWEYSARGEDHSANTRNLTVGYDIEVNDVPKLIVKQNGSNTAVYTYQYPYFNGQDDGYVVGMERPHALVYSSPTVNEIDQQDDIEYLWSSKTICVGGRNNDQSEILTYYSGPEPYGSNAYGWWFGKNGYHNLLRPSYFADGIGQAFEKPTAPYVLKKVVMQCAVLEVNAPVDLNCKIYRLDEIPAYNESESVTLPDEPGELICYGRARVTPQTFDNTGGMVTFDLYEVEDGIEADVEPMIDDAILVVVEGYNDSNMGALQDFSAMISTDMEVDEGYGELAYIKFGVPGSVYGTVNYKWTGLNNFFYNGTMKTGFSIFIVTELPYLALDNPLDNGEYEFDKDGGVMQRQLGGETVTGIIFKSWRPSADGEWTMTCRGDDVPEWLDIELVDGKTNGRFNGTVTALVSAEPLPEDVSYREAVVRFEYHGAYLDYKFKQGNKVGPGLVGDFNEDGEVNVADLNFLINLILTDTGGGDITGDGETNLADINALIDIILSNT